VRLIDSFTEGLIEKDQFTSRVARTKDRIADLTPRYRLTQAMSINWSTCGLRRSGCTNSQQPSGPDLADTNWHRRREIIRTLVQKVEIGHENIKSFFACCRMQGYQGRSRSL
jgi:site-specific DNA recombinase